MSQEKGNWEPYNVNAIVKNIEQIFKNADIKYLNKPTYQFIINSMGFIAHYDLYGFQSVYADLRKFAVKLQTSEYSSQTNYNLNWADSIERDKEFEEWHGKPYNKSKADVIRGIVAVAKKYEQEIFADFDEQEKNEEISQARALAKKHGFKLEKV
jgi:hypothetical protein